MSESPAQPQFDALTFLHHRDLIAQRVDGPPHVTLYFESPLVHSTQQAWTPGYWQLNHMIEAFLIDPEDFDKCKSATFEHFGGITDAFKVDCYDDPPKYIPGEQAELYYEDAGVVAVEPVYFDQFWDGLHGKCLIEPAQRLTLYLELEQRAGPDVMTTLWVDPYNGNAVVKRQDCGDREHARNLTIRLDRLRDYLAARRKVLYVRRWSQRYFSLDDNRLDAVRNRSTIEIEVGSICFERRNVLTTPTIEAILNQHFVIQPAPRPSHYKLRGYRNDEPPVEFLDERGDRITADRVVPPLSVISFRRHVLDQFRSNADGGWNLQSIAPGTMRLIFPRGQSLHVSDSSHGQVQCFLKDLYELDRGYQEYMCGFCEMSQGRPHANWWRPSMGFGPPQQEAFHRRLNTAKRRICDALDRVSKDSPFACLANPVLSTNIVRPHPGDGPAFARICKELYRKLFVENRPDGFIRTFGLTVIPTGRSLAAIKVFLERHAPEKAEQLFHPFHALNEFRQVDAHPKPMEKALQASGYDAQQDFGALFDRLLEELCLALETVALLVEREAAKAEVENPSDDSKTTAEAGNS